MSHCPEIVISEITAEKYQVLLTTAQAQGLNLTGTTGCTTFQGMDFTWNYDAAAQTLTIQCTEKPIFVPCSMIESRIRALIS
jgi:hypothetical protein